MLMYYAKHNTQVINLKIYSTLQRFLLPIVLIAMAGMFVLTQREYLKEMSSVESDAHRQAEALTRLLKVSEQLMMERVEASMRLLKESGENQYGSAKVDGTFAFDGKLIPNLMLGGQKQFDRFELVDSVTSIMGGSATLFVKSGDDFIRVTTTLKKNDGSRAVGTHLDPKGKAIEPLRHGKPFYGVVDILGTPYITGYEPILDANSNVIGAWYVGFKVDMQPLRESVEKARLLKTGFATVLDANKHISFLSAHVSPEFAEQQLSVKNTNWVKVTTPIPEWGFEVVMAYPSSEARTQSMTRSYSILFIFIGLSALLVGLVVFLLRHFVLKPLGGDPVVVSDLVRSISAGNLEEDDLQAEDGTLMANMLKMRRSLREMVQTLHANTERLSLSATVFEHAHDAIFITDRQGKIIECNPAFGAVTGFAREETAERSAKDLLAPPPDNERFIEIWDTLRNKGAWQGETRLVNKEGVSFAAELDLFSVDDDHGAVVHYVGVFSDITHVVEQQKKLERMAYHDPLTQIPNRVLFSDRLQQALAHGERTNGIIGVCYLDLDGFKPINDTMGHEAGDQLLIQLAHRLRGSMRIGDTIARFGGDEFAILLCDLQSPEECCQTMDRLLSLISSPYLINGESVTVSASAGLTICPPDEAKPDLLLRHADQAMYQAKLGGKNVYHVYNPEQDRQTRARHEALDSIQAGLQNHEFRLYYQPKVNMRQGKIIGFEALIRWQHPELGLRGPMEFLPVVENHDISVDIGEWVIEEALRQMQQWQRQGIYLPVSVNINARHLMQPNFTVRLTEMLAKSPNMPSSMLELEITESASLEDFASVSALIDQCRSELGVTFSLDDFGAGYSSLTYLRRLPADVVKIDQSFVRDMLRDPEDLAIVAGVISLAREFNRKVIAEGVETAEHGVKLLAMNCELAQGYGIARPMPAAAVPDWVDNYEPDATWISPYANLKLIR
jgi:diguanylate cyclase (GGDEF)-like protein/PAS domain S-box-containing protein